MAELDEVRAWCVASRATGANSFIDYPAAMFKSTSFHFSLTVCSVLVTVDGGVRIVR